MFRFAPLRAVHGRWKNFLGRVLSVQWPPAWFPVCSTLLLPVSTLHMHTAAGRHVAVKLSGHKSRPAARSVRIRKILVSKQHVASSMQLCTSVCQWHPCKFQRVKKLMFEETVKFLPFSQTILSALADTRILIRLARSPIYTREVS